MLDQLSVELSEHIAACLDDRLDLLALRLVCRHLRSATDNLFVRTCFQTLKIDFTPRSLLRLENIAHHEFLRESVRHIRVGKCGRPPVIKPFDLHPHDHLTKVYGEGNSWQRTESGSLDLDSPFIRGIQNLLLRFTRCTEISIADTLGRSSGPDNTLKLTAVDVLILMCSLLARQKVPRIESFNILFIRRLTFPRLDPLLHTTLNSPSFQASWSYIRHLKICWPIEDIIADLTLDLIIRAPRLHTLFLRSGLSLSADLFLRRLAQSPSLPTPTDISLGILMDVTPKALAGAILRFKDSLIAMRLYAVKIVNEDWSALFGLLRGEGFPFLQTIVVKRPFKAFFCPLRMRQDVLSECGGQFEFALNSCQNKTRVKSVRYHGTPSGVQLALKALANQSTYSLLTEPQSPGYPDMEHFDDRVGVLAEI